MLSNEELSTITNFLKKNSCKWVWVDITTTMGPTKLENFFVEKLGGSSLNHWSPSTPEGYLELTGAQDIVIHWIIGEKDALVNITCADDVDFDEIDKSLASTIIHNSVIRIMSEKF